MRPLTDLCRHKALIFDSTGKYVGSSKIKYDESTFKFKHRVFNFLPEKCSSFKVKYIFGTTKYYIYHLRNSNPVLLNGENRGIIDPVAYNRILQTDLIKKLNDLSKPDWIRFIMQPKILIAIIVIIVIFWFLSTGNTPQEAIGYLSGNG